MPLQLIIPEEIQNNQQVLYLYKKYYNELVSQTDNVAKIKLLIQDKIDKSTDKLDKYVYSLLYQVLFSRNEKLEKLQQQMREEEENKRIQENYLDELNKLNTQKQVIEHNIDQINKLQNEFEILLNKYPNDQLFIDDQYQKYKQAKVNCDVKLANEILTETKNYLESKYKSNETRLTESELEKIRFIHNNQKDLEYELIKKDLKKNYVNKVIQIMKFKII